MCANPAGRWAKKAAQVYGSSQSVQQVVTIKDAEGSGKSVYLDMHALSSSNSRKLTCIVHRHSSARGGKRGSVDTIYAGGVSSQAPYLCVL